MLPVTAFALLVFGGWGGGACAPSGWSPAPAPAVTPAFSPALVPFVAPRVVVRPVPPAETLDQAKARVVARRKARLDSACRDAECVSACACGRCEGECPCRATASACGGDCKCVVAASPVTNFGLDRDKLDGPPAYRKSTRGNVRDITREEALQLLEKDVPDDASKRRLTVVAPEAARKAFDAWWKTAPEAARFRSEYLVQLYAEDDWYVKRNGFQAPAVYVQAADGTVLHRQADPADLAGLGKALVRAAPDYDPAKDPDLSKAPPVPPGGNGLAKFFADVHPAVWALAGVALLLYLTRKKD